MIKIFHTSDVHLGLKFMRARYSDATRTFLVEARMKTLATMVEMATERQCDLFVVAGDLFDTTGVPKKLVRDAAEVLRRFEGTVVVLPGNHDYVKANDDTIWPAFEEQLGEGNILLQGEEPCDLRPNLNCVLFPGVCKAKHSRENAIG